MTKRPVWKIALLGAAALSLLPPASAQAQHAFDGNILFNNTVAGQCVAGGCATFDACGLIAAFPHNDLVDPMLADPYNMVSPDFTPSLLGPAIGRNDALVDPVRYARECDNLTCQTRPEWAVIRPTCFRGGVAPDEWQDPWYEGWTYRQDLWGEAGAGRTDINYARPLTIVSGDLSGSIAWDTSHNYLLRGRVNVLAGATLTIRPGTVIFGEKATTGFLVIERGATIFAVGTATAPIIFTSDQAPGSMAPGDWPGVVINGRGIANCADCRNGASCISEGTEVEHCGNDDCDSSGDLRYVRVEFAGFEIALNNEVNAFTFNSVGVNTRSEYLEAFRGKDDTFEWFGGAHVAKYLYGRGGQDDGLDWQMGWRGGVQYAIIQLWSDASDKGIEADNNEFNFNAECRSSGLVSNATFVNTSFGGTSTHGIHFRRGTDAQVYNSIIIGFNQGGLRVQNNESCARGTFPVPPVFCEGAGGASDVQPGADAAAFAVRTFPNPVVNQAHFFFRLPQAGATKLSVFDVSGREVAQIVDANLSAGTHQASWTLPADRAAAGTYFYRMQSNDDVVTGRLVTVR
jgi:hypothetical protein